LIVITVWALFKLNANESDDVEENGYFVLHFSLYFDVILYLATFENLAPAVFSMSVGVPLALAVPCLFTLRRRDLQQTDSWTLWLISAAVLTLALVILALTFSLKLITIGLTALWYLILSALSWVVLSRIWELFEDTRDSDDEFA
jgi:FlaA1/EpsC-like NDP-sugar epimerase